MASRSAVAASELPPPRPAATGIFFSIRTRHCGSTPAALSAKDYHSLWLNSAALALADGPLDVHGGVVERNAAGEPTGVLRVVAGLQFAPVAGAVDDGLDDIAGVAAGVDQFAQLVHQLDESGDRVAGRVRVFHSLPGASALVCR